MYILLFVTYLFQFEDRETVIVAPRNLQRVLFSLTSNVKFIHMCVLLFLPNVDISVQFMRPAASECHTSQVDQYYSLVCFYSQYRTKRLVLIGSLPNLSIPNIFVLFLFIDESVNRFCHSFCHHKLVFI